MAADRPAALSLFVRLSASSAAPIVFRFSLRRTVLYLLLAWASAPVIHLAFSFFLGWNEYMPFWVVPSMSSLIGS